jgi:hypothetical protein
MARTSCSIALWPTAMAVALAVGLAACDDGFVSPSGSALDAAPALAVHGYAPAAPTGLVTVGDLSLWPWTGRDLDETVADPMNLIFFGDVDLVSLRSALLSLDGDRTAFGFPADYPFNCTWTDASGSMQSAYSDGAGWVGNAIQLQCGGYDPLRFHIRLFDAGEAVIAGAHFDLLIPNTAEHQVLSWDLPQDLVMVDMMRGGFAALPEFVPVNEDAPVQAIPKPLYDQIPDELKVAVFTVQGLPSPSADLVEYAMELPFNLTVPRPFCSQGPADFVHILGPVHLTVRARVNAKGRLESHNTVRGDLSITPIDVSTGQPSGPSFMAQISEVDNTIVGPNGTSVNAVLQRKGVPTSHGFLRTHLVTGPNGSARFAYSEKCD